VHAVTLAPIDPSSGKRPPLRPPLRPPIGVPLRGESRRQGTLVSIALHALVIFLVVAPPVFLAAKLDFIPSRGSGGKGPAGGGGGGSGGSGGLSLVRERLRYLVLPPGTAQPALPTPPPEVPVVKPVEPPKIQEPPKPVPTPVPVPVPPTASVVQATGASESGAKDASVVTGAGGGSGKDGSGGSGAGSGGGVGTGVGTGRGSGTGSGTGGGEDAVYPPAVISLPILPLPVPGKVRPYKMTAYFEVDTLGNARLLAFNPSNDGGYNKRIREMLSEIRFRAATRLDGRAVIDTAVVTAEAARS
ncbi:MAG: hypothetical protein ABIZ91_11130, partial [Gemmatimonadaceae bacterium]